MSYLVYSVIDRDAWASRKSELLHVLLAELFQSLKGQLLAQEVVEVFKIAQSLQ